MPISYSPILIVRNLKKYFPIKGGILNRTVNFVKAVDGIDIEIQRGETLALVGESGCGKTTLGRTILRLLKPTSGEILFSPQEEDLKEIKSLEQKETDGKISSAERKRLKELKDRYDISFKSEKELKELRKKMQVVFQDPLSSLDPRMTIKEILSEPFKVHTNLSSSEIEERVLGLLQSAGLKEEHLYRYPHEFSGGQKQRICILRAIALNPEFIILDEPTSALDVSVQAQILNLLKDLQETYKLTYLFITHDLSVVRFMSTRVAVMYLGKIVEIAPTDELFSTPLHPCTRSLLDAIPIPDPTLKREKDIIEGDVPTPIDPPTGCRFHPRCPYAKESCSRKEPSLKEALPNHFVACPFFKGN